MPDVLDQFRQDQRTANPSVDLSNRHTRPHVHTSHADDRAFNVWANVPAYAEDPEPTKCVATFRFLQEALDYVDYCTNRGQGCYLQTPTGVREYNPK